MCIRKSLRIPVALAALYAGAALAVNVPVNVILVDAKDNTAMNVKQIVINPGPGEKVHENKDEDNRVGGLLLEAGKEYRVEAKNARGEKHTGTIVVPEKGGDVTVKLAPAVVAVGLAGSLQSSWDWSSGSPESPRYHYYGEIEFARWNYDLPGAALTANRESFLMENPGGSFDGSFDDTGTGAGLYIGGEWQLPGGGDPSLKDVKLYVGWRAGLATVPNFSTTFNTTSDFIAVSPGGEVVQAEVEEKIDARFKGDWSYSLEGTFRAQWGNGWGAGIMAGLRRVEIEKQVTARAFYSGIQVIEIAGEPQDLTDTAWTYGAFIDYDLKKTGMISDPWRIKLGYDQTKLDAEELDDNMSRWTFSVIREFGGSAYPTTHTGP